MPDGTEVRVASREEIPIVDIAPLVDDSSPETVAAELAAASHNVGFLYAANHGVDQALIDGARTIGLTFFNAAEDLKQTVAVNEHHHGWIGLGHARMQPGDRPDLKESFVWGREPAASHDHSTRSSHSLRGSNRWPAIEGLRDVALDYTAAVDRVARVLLEGFAIGLDLPRDTFIRTASDPLTRTSFTFYPPQPDDDEEQFGVGPHTDFGVLTVLCQDDVGGLQVQSQGEWIAAPPIEGTFVVNVGDLLDRWTNSYYQSTPHRVINHSGRQRLSLVHAFDPDPETRVDATDVFPAEPAKAPAITCGDYLTERFARSFAYRKS